MAAFNPAEDCDRCYRPEQDVVCTEHRRFAASIGAGIAQNPDRKRIISVLDIGSGSYGATFSINSEGISYIAPDGRHKKSRKAPMAILRSRSADGQVTYTFGETALKKYSAALSDDRHLALFTNLKMHLSNFQHSVEDISITAKNGEVESLLTLFAELMNYLKNHIVGLIIKGEPVTSEFRGRARADAEANIQWILSIPVIWTEAAKDFMRRAAVRAGLVSSENASEIWFVLEPEAAAISVHSSLSIGGTSGLLELGKRFIVIDMGDGTTDIVVLEVVSISPLRLRKISSPVGRPWGSRNVNAAFERFLNRLFKPVLRTNSTVESQFPLEFNRIRRQFDQFKESFKMDETYSLPLADIIPSGMSLQQLRVIYNRDYCREPNFVTVADPHSSSALEIGKDLMQSFFIIDLEGIVALMTCIIGQNAGVERIVLVGGYACSCIIQERFFKEFDGENGIRVLSSGTDASYVQGAIAEGAVLWGLYASIVPIRAANWTVAVRTVRDYLVMIVKGTDLDVKNSYTVISKSSRDDQEFVDWPIFKSDHAIPASRDQFTLLDTLRVWFSPDAPLKEQTAVFRFDLSHITVSISQSDGTVSSHHVAYV